jgi:DNA-binding transcriptional LysR family regulator
MMELQKLRGFYWAVRCRSFSEAAAKIHVSQSAISHQVRALEEELGVRLYERSGRGIVPTPEGERLADYARSLLNTLDDLHSEFAELAGRPHGAIRVAASRGVATFRLPGIVQTFRRAYPDVRLTISSRVLDTDILRLVLSGEVDIGFTASWNDFSDVEYFEILSYDMFVCTPLDHEWAGRRDRISLNELAEQPLLLYEKGTAVRNHIDRVFARHGLSPEVTIEVGGSTALREYVRIGLGISITSGLVLSESSCEGVHCISVTEVFGRLGYGIVLRKGRHVPAAVREFMRCSGVADEIIPRGA